MKYDESTYPTYTYILHSQVNIPSLLLVHSNEHLAPKRIKAEEADGSCVLVTTTIYVHFSSRDSSCGLRLLGSGVQCVCSDCTWTRGKERQTVRRRKTRRNKNREREGEISLLWNRMLLIPCNFSYFNKMVVMSRVARSCVGFVWLKFCIFIISYDYIKCIYLTHSLFRVCTRAYVGRVYLQGADNGDNGGGDDMRMICNSIQYIYDWVSKTGTIEY